MTWAYTISNTGTIVIDGAIAALRDLLKHCEPWIAGDSWSIHVEPVTNDGKGEK